jgi:hypothetical protein
VISQPKILPTDNREFGLGDLNPSLFLSPAKSGAIIWGIGPTFLLPTATDQNLGNHRWGAGPSAVVLTIQGHWLYGVLANNIWSFASTGKGSNVNQMLIQPFVNYNFPEGWYLTSSPVVTADWLARGRKWTVPVGGGFGRLFKVDKQPINMQVQAFYNAETPKGGPGGKHASRFSSCFRNRRPRRSAFDLQGRDRGARQRAAAGTRARR